MESIRRLHEEILKREYKAEKQRKEEMRYDQMDCLLLAGEEKTERTIPVCETVFPEKFADLNAVREVLLTPEKQVYALIAPAFMGQFGEGVSPGAIRAALKCAGFSGMVEVAVFADILTLKEALEFDRHVNRDTDFLLTSCCCPVWVSMIRNIYGELVPHMPGAVSPMIAAGRAVKKMHPDAVTVFIGPCLAKKKEAKEPDICDAIDVVLTFQETAMLFEAMGIAPQQMEEDASEHSSGAGRIYARTGGVSEAVVRTVEQLHPGRKIAVRPMQADGGKACKQMIEAIQAGKTEANFFEGMGCVGGCVGGPRALLPREEGSAYVDHYGKEALYQTPLENPYVIELLEKLGFSTVEDFLEKSDLLTRHF